MKKDKEIKEEKLGKVAGGTEENTVTKYCKICGKAYTRPENYKGAINCCGKAIVFTTFLKA